MDKVTNNVNMKHIIVWAGLMAATTTTTLAQTLRGVIANEEGKPLAYANVILEQRGDSAFINGAVSGEDGRFALEYKGKTPFSPQDVFLKVSSIGYNTTSYPLTATEVGVLRLKANSAELKGVTVKGNRPLYRMSGGGFITDVETSVLSKAGTVEDVLKHIPGVTKKKEGFEVFGKGAPLIYINGRKVQDISELDNLKSEDVKEVELIRNPGAAYDAEVGAVIIIRTKRIKGDGFGFDLRSSCYRSTDTDWIQQANLNYHHNRWDVFGTFKYFHSEEFSVENYRQLTQTTDALWQQKMDGHNNFRTETYTAIAGFSYAFNHENSVGARYTAECKPYDVSSGTYDNAILRIPDDKSFYERSQTFLYVPVHHHPRHLLNVYYNGKAGKTTIDFNTDYMQDRSTRHSSSRELSEVLQDSREVVSDNAVKNRLIASKLVLGHPLWGGDLSLGTEYTFTDRTDSYLSRTEQYVPSSSTRLKEQHVSPFLEYQRTTPLGMLTAGVRYERVKFDYYDEGVWQADGSRKYGDWFPSVSLSNQLGNVQLQLNYTTKTIRPSYTQLSNNVLYVNRFTMQKGNPLLRSSYVHSLELSGMWNFLQLSAAFTDTKNQIIWTAMQEDPKSPQTYVSYRNLNDLKAVTANLTIAPKIAFWSPQLYLALYKQWLNFKTLEGTLKMNKPYYTVMFNNAFILPANFIFNVDFQYISGGYTENIYLPKSRNRLDISLVKTFFHDRLSIQLKGNDIFYKMLDSNRLYDVRSIFETSNKYDSREFVVTIRYKFNTGKNRYKGTGAGNGEKSRL